MFVRSDPAIEDREVYDKSAMIKLISLIPYHTYRRKIVPILVNFSITLWCVFKNECTIVNLRYIAVDFFFIYVVFVFLKVIWKEKIS